MKTKFIKEVVEEFENEITIHDLHIGGEVFRLTINNYGDFQEVVLSFTRDNNTNEEFSISIDKEKKMKFNRLVYRPHHDHDDTESLQVKISGEEDKQTPFWHTRFPYEGEGREFFKIDFGPVTVDY